MNYTQSFIISVVVSIIATLILWQILAIYNVNWFWAIIIGVAIAFGLFFIISRFILPPKKQIVIETKSI